MKKLSVPSLILFLAIGLSACGGEAPSNSMNLSASEPTEPETLPPECYEPYARELLSFNAGENAGYGQVDLPEVVLGPTTTGSVITGSINVLSLGAGGEIILGFGDRKIVNGPGNDFVVWENPFYVNGDPLVSYAEFGEISVSLDGEEWHIFPCNPENMDGASSGCAGWFPRKEFDPCDVLPLDPQLVGGDQFDLEEIGLSEIRYVKIRDVSDSGESPTAGFDLDAVGAFNLSE